MPAVVHTIADLRRRLEARRASGRVGFVPTMGALHAGHAALVDCARSESETVVVSIFVNPLQFDRADDLERYPRTLDADVALCGAHGADVVFAPAASEMYPEPPACTVVVGAIADHLCGAHRPGHFGGVATVVLKLFEIVRADAAFFGEKDAQQLAIIRRLVRDFNVPIQIVGVPTVREPDGLALSSRNRHLNEGERALAPALYRALLKAGRQIESGVSDPTAVVRDATADLRGRGGVRIEYFEIVDPGQLQPVTAIAGPVLVAAAIWLGTTRLIDNIVRAPQAVGSEKA